MHWAWGQQELRPVPVTFLYRQLQSGRESSPSGEGWFRRPCHVSKWSRLYLTRTFNPCAPAEASFPSGRSLFTSLELASLLVLHIWSRTAWPVVAVQIVCGVSGRVLEVRGEKILKPSLLLQGFLSDIKDLVNHVEMQFARMLSNAPHNIEERREKERRGQMRIALVFAFIQVHWFMDHTTTSCTCVWVHSFTLAL